MPAPTDPAHDVELSLTDGRRVHVRAAIAGLIRGIDADGNLLVALGEPDAPIHHPDGTDYLIPLTGCCQATGKGAPSRTGVACRSCYREVDGKYGGPSTLAVAVTSTVVRTVCLHGLTGHPVTVTATITIADCPPTLTLNGGNPGYHPELQRQVATALIHSDLPDERGHAEVDLDAAGSAPPGTTAGTAAVAIAVLTATTSGADAGRLAGTAVLGDVNPDGSLRMTRGVLPAVQAARNHGVRRVILPTAALGQAALVDGIDALGAQSLTEVAAWLRGDDTVLTRPAAPATAVAKERRLPLRALAAPALRAVELAAAGGHHLLLDIDDTAGTLLTAEWLHLLLPDLTAAQQLEVAAIHSLTGHREDGALVPTPPKILAHHTRSYPVSLIGGSVPGAVSAAHHGLLVTGDLDLFSVECIEALRTVLLRREVLLTRGGAPLRYPAGMQLLATTTRTPNRWRGPHLALLDTIDIRLRQPTAQDLTNPQADDPHQISQILAQARARVTAARDRATARWNKAADGGTGTDGAVTNASVPADILAAHPLPAEATDLINEVLDIGALSRRGADTAARLTWSIADLDGADLPDRGHAEEALHLRMALTHTVPTPAGRAPQREVR